MSVFRYLIILLFTAFASHVVHAQPPVQYPAPPLYYVTVNVETSSDSLIWFSIADQAPEIDYYVVAIATIVNPNVDPPDIAFVPVGSTATEDDTVFVNAGLESSIHSIGYTVWGINDLGGGLFTPGSFEQPPDSTIFLRAEFDSCLATITLFWNDYNKWRGSIREYNIYRRTAPYNYVPVASNIPEGTNTWVINNVAANQQYDLFVEAVNQDMARRSTSNRTMVFTTIVQQPNRTNADYATISAANSIDMAFTIIGTPNGSEFSLMRGNNPGGDFTQIATFENISGNQILYTDNIPFTSGVYYYRLDGLNGCNQTSPVSNMANNIVLNGTLSGNIISVSWNEYYDWSGGVQQYRIIRTSGRTNPVTDTLNQGPTASFFLDDIQAMVNYEDPVSSLVCYQVEATENINIYGTQGKSLSNRLCFSINPDIRLPNAIIPNDADEVNRRFEPVFSFQPEQYEITIYNRLGTRIWEGSYPWDGTVNGKFVPEGVYLYYVRVYNYSTEYIELNGKLTVVYR